MLYVQMHTITSRWGRLEPRLKNRSTSNRIDQIQIWTLGHAHNNGKHYNWRENSELRN